MGTIARHGAAVRWVSLAAIALSLVLLVRTLPVDRSAQEVLRRIHGLGAWGPVALGAVYIVAVLLLVPGSVLTLVISGLYGLATGMLVVSLAATTAAALAFLIARYTLRDRVRRMIERSPKLAAVDRAIGEEGWRIVALLRLSPAVPFNLQNYLYGVTAVRFWPCVLTSWAAMLPGTFLYVYVGSLGRTAAGGRATTAEWVLRGVGLLATVVATVYVARVARRAIRRRTDIADVADQATAAGPQDRPADAVPSDRGKTTLAGEPAPADQPRSLWGTLVIAVLAMTLLGLAVWATFRPGVIRRWVSGSCSASPLVAGMPDQLGHANRAVEAYGLYRPQPRDADSHPQPVRPLRLDGSPFFESLAYPVQDGRLLR